MNAITITPKLLRNLALVMVIVGSSTILMADEINIAVASNFSEAMKKITLRFEQQNPYRVLLSPGSTGKHYSQIKNGAPFDLFFAADSLRPVLLENEGIAVPGTRFTYAVGKIILWSPVAGLVDSAGQVLTNRTFHHLAIANPKLAPFGKAAQEVLMNLNLWDTVRLKIVYGENIAQTYQFVTSGTVQLGFISLSQLQRPDAATAGSFWVVPQSLYTPIVQQAICMKDGPAARAFLAFVKTDDAKRIIRSYGYALP